MQNMLKINNLIIKLLPALLLVTFNIAAQSNVAPNATPIVKPSPYEKGQQYEELDPAFDTNDEKHVIVYEFFGYKCPHCATFQHFINPWHKKLPEHIKLVRVPVIFQPSWKMFAKVYYTLQAMDVIEKIHQPLFDAIHKQRKKFRKIEHVAKWLNDKYGVDEEKFISTSQSFLVDSQVRKAKNMMLKMKINSTPTLVVNGKYKPHPKKIDTTSGLLDLVSYFANQEALKMGLIKK